MTIGNVSARRLPNWILSFIRQTEGFDSPEIFRKWAGIGVLSAIMERKVFANTANGIIFPNLYTVLVGPPGAGKSIVISHCERMLRKVEEIHIAPSSVTTASLIDTLQISQRKVLYPTFLQFNGVQVLSSELQNFLPAYEASFMGVLTKLYDCELYEERRRTGKVNHIKIDHTQVSILAGTTPAYLNSLLPESAWDQGFTSRTIFVFSEKTFNGANIFSTESRYEDQLQEDLLHDLRVMMHSVGQIFWSKPAIAEFEFWINGGYQPVPGHARLQHYNSRRLVHALKLSIIACMSRQDQEMKVSAEDFHTAKGWLLEAEAAMPDIFRSMSITGEARSMEDAHYYLKQLAIKMKGPVPEHYLIGFLKDRIASQNLSKVIEIMCRSKMIRQEFIASVPHYTPL